MGNTEHKATVTAMWLNCGEIHLRVVCACGYDGLYADGKGCWQEGHNIPLDVDATHDPLITLAYAAETPGSLDTWRPGPAQPTKSVEVAL